MSVEGLGCRARSAAGVINATIKRDLVALSSVLNGPRSRLVLVRASY